MTWSVGVIIPFPCILDVVKATSDREVHEKARLALELEELNLGLRIGLLLHISCVYLRY